MAQDTLARPHRDDCADPLRGVPLEAAPRAQGCQPASCRPVDAHMLTSLWLLPLFPRWMVTKSDTLVMLARRPSLTSLFTDTVSIGYIILFVLSPSRVVVFLSVPYLRWQYSSGTSDPALGPPCACPVSTCKSSRISEGLVRPLSFALSLRWSE